MVSSSSALGHARGALRPRRPHYSPTPPVPLPPAQCDPANPPALSPSTYVVFPLRANIGYVWAFALMYFFVCWLVLAFKPYSKR